MATFKQNCPHCQSELELENQWIGMEAECPECQQSFKVNPPAQSAPKRQLPPPGVPKHNMPMGSPFAPPVSAPPPPMMNQLTADEYLYIRNRKIMNFFAIVCILLSIASAVFAVTNYEGGHTSLGERPQATVETQYEYGIAVSRDVGVTVGDSSLATANNTAVIASNQGSIRQAFQSVCLSVFSVVFMLLAIFLKLHQILGALTLKARR